MGTSIPEIFQRKGSQNWWAKRQTPVDLWRDRELVQAHDIKLSQVILRGSPVLVPSLAEQQDFLNHIGVELLKLAGEEGLIFRQVGLLKERRGALISAAVTGKIDVRRIAAKQEDA